MADWLARKHRERASMYAAERNWEKHDAHVARARHYERVAFGSMDEQKGLDKYARKANFRFVAEGSRACKPTRGGESKTACKFQRCDSDENCETDFTKCYLESTVSTKDKTSYKCRGRYGSGKKGAEEPRRTCTYSVAHSKCMLDRSRDETFENGEVCMYHDKLQRCETKDGAAELAAEYFVRSAPEARHEHIEQTTIDAASVQSEAESRTNIESAANSLVRKGAAAHPTQLVLSDPGALAGSKARASPERHAVEKRGSGDLSDRARAEKVARQLRALGPYNGAGAKEATEATEVLEGRLSRSKKPA